MAGDVRFIKGEVAALSAGAGHEQGFTDWQASPDGRDAWCKNGALRWRHLWTRTVFVADSSIAAFSKTMPDFAGKWRNYTAICSLSIATA